VLVRRGDDVGAITAAALHPLYKAAVHFILTLDTAKIEV